MNDVCLVTFAREPIPGQVKTRLRESAKLSDLSACRLYLAFLRDVLGNAALAASFPRRRLYVAGDPKNEVLRGIARECGYCASDDVVAQERGADLGERMDAAIRRELEAGARAVVLIGSDAPTLPVPYLEQASARLASGEADLVLGPATDGGYYLIGVDKPVSALFTSHGQTQIPWGTGAVLVATLRRIQALRSSGELEKVHLLPFHYDVDDAADLELLKSHLLLCPELAPTTYEAIAALAEDSYFS